MAMGYILHTINNNYLTVPEYEVHIIDYTILSVFPTLFDTMGNKDRLFSLMFRDFLFGGSYYDNLTDGNPEQFELNLLLRMPEWAKPQLNHRGFGFVQLEVAELLYEDFETLLDNKIHVNTEKVLTWTESLIRKSLSELSIVQGISNITFSRSGSTLTFHIVSLGKIMDVNLVPCFVFGGDKWPQGFRPNPVASQTEFFIVPKKSKGFEEMPQLWRLSFQEQEREIINNKVLLKPTIKLLKKMRDKYKDNWIADYYIKTIFLHACQRKDEMYWANPLGLDNVFMDMLREYQQCIEQRKIHYFWNENYNLFDNKVNKRAIRRVNRRLKRIIKTLESNRYEPTLVAKFLVNPQQYNQIVNDFYSWPPRIEPEIYPWIQPEIYFARPKDYSEFILFILFIFAAICIHLGRPTTGFTIILLEALYISARITKIEPSTGVKYALASIFIIFTALNKKPMLVLQLCCAVVLLEAIPKVASTFSYTESDFYNHCITCLLVGFWVFSFNEPSRVTRYAMRTGIPQRINILIVYLVTNQETVSLTVATIFLLFPIVELVFLGYFTEHAAIAVTIFGIWYFRLVPDLERLLCLVVGSVATTFLGRLTYEALSYQNVCIGSLMAGAVLCQEHPNFVLDVGGTTVLIGAGMLLTKGITYVLGNFGFNKYVVAATVLSCLGHSCVEVL